MFKPDAIPVIVPKDLFDRVQEKLAKNKKAPARHKEEDDYLLTTKLFCGECGAMMYGECGTGHSGNSYHYYKCRTVKKHNGKCSKKPVRKQWIEDLVVAEAQKVIMNDMAIEKIVTMMLAMGSRIPSCRARSASHSCAGMNGAFYGCAPDATIPKVFSRQGQAFCLLCPMYLLRRTGFRLLTHQAPIA